jgi:hypothetical protein
MMHLSKSRAAGARTVLVLLALASILRAADQDSLPDKLRQATAAVAKTKADVLGKLADTPEYEDASADVGVKRRALDTARAKGTPQEKLTASAAYTKARAALEKIKTDAWANDPDVKAAEAHLADAKAALEREPKELASGEKMPVVGQTEAEAERIFGKGNVIGETTDAKGTGKEIIYFIGTNRTPAGDGTHFWRYDVIFVNGAVAQVNKLEVQMGTRDMPYTSVFRVNGKDSKGS